MRCCIPRSSPSKKDIQISQIANSKRLKEIQDREIADGQVNDVSKKIFDEMKVTQ